MGEAVEITRRVLLGRALSGATAAALAGSAPAFAKRHHRHRRSIALPSPAEVRAEFTRMVRFGPRLTGSASHNRYITWLEQEFTRAGLTLEPCDEYETDRWLTEKAELSVSGNPVPVAAYYPRSAWTPPAGIGAPLVYGGAVPVPSIDGLDVDALAAALERYPAQLASWLEGLAGRLTGGTQGSILLIDLPIPLPLTGAAFLPISTYLQWPGHSLLDWATSDYKRLWIEPGLGIPLAPFQALGAAAVVFIVDASFAALQGGYLPFGHGLEPLPALYVDRDTGTRLRAVARGRPEARLTLTGSRAAVPTPAITAVLHGSSDETIIFNTHTDGQGFAEENGGVALLLLARHLASLPRSERLKRTLVFAAWPGHMTYDLPQTQGWIDAHPALVDRAAAALTVEHLGCSEWTDTAARGYRPTGQPEMFAVWTTQGPMFELTRETVVRHGLPRTALMRPPVQFGVGAAFQSAGVPQIGAIAGPEYLVTVSDNGDLDKLDARLASRQIAWLADMARSVDATEADALRQGDPTLGLGKSSTPSSSSSSAIVCSAVR